MRDQGDFYPFDSCILMNHSLKSVDVDISAMKRPILSRSMISTTWDSFKKNIPRALSLIFTYTPWWTTASIILIFILGLLPLASLYIMKLIVDTVTAGINAPGTDLILHQLTVIIVLAAILAMCTTAGKALLSYITEVQSLTMTDRISSLIHAHSLQMDIAYYENPEYHNTLHRAQMDGPSRPGKIVNNLVQIGQSCISLAAVGSLVLSFSPLAGFILLGAALPAAGLKVWYSHKTYDLTLSQTELERKSTYFHFILTNPIFAKELRLFSSGSFFEEKFNSVRLSIRRARLQLSRSKAFWDTLAQGCITVAVFGSFMVIAEMTLKGETTLGTMVVFFFGFQMCTGFIQIIFGSLNALYEDNLFLSNLFDFFDLKPAISSPENPTPLPTHMQKEITVSGVHFTYPGTDNIVLSDISLTIQKGSITAFVGENGAGKSSLVKLLCLLYQPDTGSISIDGIDMRTIDPDEWRRKISVVFQDYIQYHLNARENIWISDITQDPCSSRIEVAAEESGADRVIKNLPEGYGTILGRFFTRGQELSIGQWQKIALARAFFRDADIVILDEPASFLDSLAEAEIFSRFKEIVKGKTAILISHRFSTVKMADYIYVLKEGRIIEEGSHDHLLAKNGHYAEMYHAQADLYTP